MSRAWRGLGISWKRSAVSIREDPGCISPSFTVAKVRGCQGEDVTSRKKNLRGQRLGGPHLDRSSPPNPIQGGVTLRRAALGKEAAAGVLAEKGPCWTPRVPALPARTRGQAAPHPAWWVPWSKDVCPGSQIQQPKPGFEALFK